MIDKDKTAFTTITGEKRYIIEGERYQVKGKRCPECHKLTDFAVCPYKVYDYYTDEIVSDDKEVYCGNGCELWGDDYLKYEAPKFDKAALKREIMASRARFRDTSLEVYNLSDNPYLHGYNCLYIHWKEIEKGQHTGEYSVFFDYYLEYAHNGRDESIGKKDMVIRKGKPTSKEAKELLYAWMVERFEKMANNE